MSFADRVRAELSELAVKHNCCRRALLEGLLLGAYFDADAKCVRVRYGQEAIADLAAELISKQFGKQPEVIRSGKCGHNYWDISVSAPACTRLVRSMDAEDASSDSVFHFGCDACRSIFLRGSFLALGTVNDPHKSFHMEWKLLPTRVALLSGLLDSLGYPARQVNRPDSVGLYYKDSSAIEDLITLMGSSHVLFEVINSRIERDIRNNENRATNCVARNIEKTIAAATRQMEAINRLVETGRLDSLPEGLQETARIRYANPDASLDELTTLHSPTISKSGLNHRLQKLVDAADEL